MRIYSPDTDPDEDDLPEPAIGFGGRNRVDLHPDPAEPHDGPTVERGPLATFAAFVGLCGVLLFAAAGFCAALGCGFRLFRLCAGV